MRGARWHYCPTAVWHAEQGRLSICYVAMNKVTKDKEEKGGRGEVCVCVYVGGKAGKVAQRFQRT